MFEFEITKKSSKFPVIFKKLYEKFQWISVNLAKLYRSERIIDRKTVQNTVKMAFLEVLLIF